MKKILLFFFLLLYSPPLWGEIIIDLNTNRQYEGAIIESESNAKWVVLKLAGGARLRFLRKQIKIKTAGQLGPLSSFLKAIDKKNPAREEKDPTPKTTIIPPNEKKPLVTIKRLPQAPRPLLEAHPVSKEKNSNFFGNSPSPLLPPQTSFLDCLMNRPWYIKFYLGAVFVLSIFVVSWKLFGVKNTSGK